MKQNIKLAVLLLLGAILSACTAEQQQTNHLPTNESTAAEYDQRISPAPTAGIHTDAPVEDTLSEATPVLEEAVLTQPLYRMNKSYRFEPIDASVQNKVVLLTFDDGPKDEAVLTSILDTLDKHHAKAIFS